MKIRIRSKEENSMKCVSKEGAVVYHGYVSGTVPEWLSPVLSFTWCCGDDVVWCSQILSGDTRCSDLCCFYPNLTTQWLFLVASQRRSHPGHDHLGSQVVRVWPQGKSGLCFQKRWCGLFSLSSLSVKHAEGGRQRCSPSVLRCTPMLKERKSGESGYILAI